MNIKQYYESLCENDRIDRLPVFVRKSTIVSFIVANYPDKFEHILFNNPDDTTDGRIFEMCIKSIEKEIGASI